jgi:D-mannonate dehydratase
VHEGVEVKLARHPETAETVILGTIRISVCERAIERYAAMALMKRSPKMTAN